MALFDPSSCPHACDTYSAAYTTDAGGGSQAAYTLVESGVPCWAPSVSGGEQERFSQSQLAVEHTIYARADSFATTPQRGWKLVVNGASLHITGINVNQAAGTLPSLIEIKAQQLL